MRKTQKLQSKGAAALDSDQGSSVDGAEGDYVTLATIRELLKVQESTFKLLFETTIQSLNLRVDSVVKDVQELKTSLQYTQKDVAELKPIHVKLEDVNKELDKISKDLASHSQKMEYLENQSRRNNIRVNGIPESDIETWEDAAPGEEEEAPGFYIGFLTITTFKFVKLSSLSYYKFIVYCVIIIFFLLIFCVVDGKKKKKKSSGSLLALEGTRQCFSMLYSVNMSAKSKTCSEFSRVSFRVTP